MMWSGMEGMGWGWIGLGLVHMVVFWGLVILALVALVKWVGGSERPFPDRPIDILRARYAKGELTREQFEQMKRELAE
jgi:putative membrane protein